MYTENDIVITIPARYGSSRLPGKPLLNICGKPMIVRTWERVNAISTKVLSTHVLTDHIRIAEILKDENIPHALLTNFCLTGTDRVAAFVRMIGIKNKIVINVQGDEPCISPECIDDFITKSLDFFNYTGKGNELHNVTNAITPLGKEELNNSYIPKVAQSGGKIHYISRSNIPSNYKNKANLYKQVGMYAYKSEILDSFYDMEKTPLEDSEDIEILRFIEKGIMVVPVVIDYKATSVDDAISLNLARTLWDPV